ncbi:MAG: serine O-acetyltransferase [Anaerolineae bacterium]|nr:serine O-acetyltransferase [Anaerolineae bacterium]
MFDTIRQDLNCILERDPAAHSRLEILLAYSGLHAVWLHRINHRLWQAGLRTPARVLAQLARGLTGIEIHPGATIGPRLFIDHGMGVVIGETAELGADVTLYHGVTLGGVSTEPGKRHPTLEDGVVVGAGAKVLGAITVGKNTRIGANAVVVKDVEPEMVVVGIPGKPIQRAAGSTGRTDLHHDVLPDIVSERLDRVLDRLALIEQAVNDHNSQHRDEAHPLPEPDYVI